MATTNASKPEYLGVVALILLIYNNNLSHRAVCARVDL
jgi:hypothetical protein